MPDGGVGGRSWEDWGGEDRDGRTGEVRWGWAVFGVFQGRDGAAICPLLVRTNFRPPWWKRAVLHFLMGSTWTRLP